MSINNNELITVIVPVYNGERYLRDCIESILNQEYKNFELILINDGSTDASEDICREYVKRDDRVKVYSTENSGQSHARNIGLDKSRGEYICFADSDDLVAPCYISRLYESIKSNDADIAVCLYDRISEKISYREIQSAGSKAQDIRENRDKFEEIISVGNREENLARLTGLKTRNWGPHCKLYRRKLLEGIRFDERFRIEEDLLFNICAFGIAKKIIYTNQSLYYYRMNSGSVTNRRNYSDYLGATRILKGILDSEEENSGTEYYKNILTEYIETNLVLAEITYILKNNNRAQIYKEIRKDILPYRKTENMLKPYNNVLYKMFCHSDALYLWALRIKMKLREAVRHK